MVNDRALAWIAGFLEGEGSFCGGISQFTVSAVQVQKEPLDRLHLALGGFLKPYINQRGTLIWRWTINGAYAMGVAYTLYTFMSPRRREQIRRMVARWKTRPGKKRTGQFRVTHCQEGHELGPHNTYRRVGKGRTCKICANEQARRWSLEHPERRREISRRSSQKMYRQKHPQTPLSQGSHGEIESAGDAQES